MSPALGSVVEPGTTVTLTVKPDPVHEQWEAREQLPSCGEFTPTWKDDSEDETREGLPCLRDRLASGRGGEVLLHRTTAQGQPVDLYVRVTPSGEVERYYDNSRDDWGSHRWEFSSCGAVEKIVELSFC